MKKVLAIIILLALGALLTGWLSRPEAQATPVVGKDLIRFHVLANSDSDADQLLKRQVRDAILAKFSPVLAKSPSLEASRQIAKDNLRAMEKEAAKVIASKGKSYPVRAEYGDFNFPVKSYGDLTLPAGSYEAVRIIIGEGKGANWWCVLFPPLCFVDVTTSLAHNPALEQGLAESEPDRTVKPMVKLKSIEVIKDLLGLDKSSES